MRIRVGGKKCHFVGMSLLLLLFLSVFLVCTASAVDQPKGTLGVALGEITPDIKQAAGLQAVNGAMIQQVLPDSAAARVGLQPGDLVIGVNGYGVDGPADVVQRVGKHSSGESVALVILRPDGQGHVQQYQVNPVLQPAVAGFTPGQQVSQPTQPSSNSRSKPLAKSPSGPKGSTRKQKPTSTSSSLGTEFSGSMLPVRKHVSQNGYCSAVAPANWGIYGVGPQGDALDIATLDRSMAAAYGINGIQSIAIRYDPNQFATLELYIHHYLTVGGKYQVLYGQPIRDETTGYTLLPFEVPEGRSVKGVIFYRVWPIPGDPGGYILLLRQAQTWKNLWERQGAQAIAVALSIRCTRQLRPTEPTGGSGGSGGRGRSDDEKAESTYNQQLGMEYAHDATTGENYWVSPSTDWDDTGPEGPGYYKRSGNDRRKLAPGRN